MQYKCDKCNDSGSLNKFGPYYDCTSCDAAEQRVALEKWCSETQQRGPSFDDCWAIHQRALAMAPKQEPEPSLLWDAEDPEDGAHASSAADFARNYAEAAMSKGEVLDVSVITDVHSRTRTMRIKVKDVDDGEWLEWEWLDDAAPAAANGAPESQPLIGKIMDRFSELPVLWGLNEPGALLRHSDVFRMLVDANREQAATLAAVGPDAALPDFCFEDDTDFMHRLGLLMNTKWPEMRKDGLARKISELANAHIRAALSGAKGNA